MLAAELGITPTGLISWRITVGALLKATIMVPWKRAQAGVSDSFRSPSHPNAQLHPVEVTFRAGDRFVVEEGIVEVHRRLEGSALVQFVSAPGRVAPAGVGALGQTEEPADCLATPRRTRGVGLQAVSNDRGHRSVLP